MIARMSSSALTTIPLIKLPKIRSSLIPNEQSPPPHQHRIDSKSQNIVNPMKDFCSFVSPQKLLNSGSIPVAAFALPFFLCPQGAQAVGGQFGILESKPFAIIHPITMLGLFLFTVYTGSLGLKVRRLRKIQQEIDELKKQVKPAGGKSADESRTSSSAKIQQLTEKRKELMQVGSYRDRHYSAGSIVLGYGVFEAVYGGLITWFRKGGLLVGPHLFAGTAMAVLWAAAASLAPAMLKGSKTARNLHVTLNALTVILFLVQILTGIKMIFEVVF